MTEAPDTILVTGASSGIGQAIAVRLAADGYSIVVHYGRNHGGAKSTCNEIRASDGQARMLAFDVGDTADCRECINKDIAEHGAYYGIVCNAGMNHDAAFPMLSEDNWKRVIAVNLDAFYNVIHPAVMPMIRRRKPGRIVTVASVSAIMGNRGQVNYSAAKAGVIGATKALAVELAKRNITVNCVAPGLIETEMTKDSGLEEIINSIPMRRMGKADEVAALVSFLCSRESSYITRQVLSVNGGLC